MDTWNPDQYHRFRNERAQPFWDLSNAVDFTHVRSMLDLGCGTGELTKALHEQHRLQHTLGIDSSIKMLAQAPRSPGLEFREAQIENFRCAQKFDLVISNAALQWVENHRDLLVQVITWSQGQIAVQMPINFDHPSHRLAEELAQEFGLVIRRSPVLLPEEYAQIFFEQKLRNIRILSRVYLHPMPSIESVTEWTKGTLLTFYEKQLGPERYREFLLRYQQELARLAQPGEYLYTFKRLFLYGSI